jgi:hypothetical protein
VSIYVGSATDKYLGVRGRIFLDYEDPEERRNPTRHDNRTISRHVREIDAESTPDNMFFALARLEKPADIAWGQNLIRILEAAAITTLRLRLPWPNGSESQCVLI